MKPLLIGMARNDNRRGPPLNPEGGGGAGDRLLKISGMTRDEYLSTFRRCNILPFGRWSSLRARRRGLRLQGTLRGKVIVLGRETWRALGLPRVGFFTRLRTSEAEFILLPHPSGRNLIYNDARARGRARRILRSVD